MIETVPNPSTLCGNKLTYESKFMNAPIDASYDPVTDPLYRPVSYDAATRTHTVYSEDFGLTSTPRLYTVSAFMTDQPHITSLPDVEAYIVFQDPCLDPELVAATP